MKRFRCFPMVICFLLCAYCFMNVAGCSKPRLAKRNVVLISLDTLRADHLGCHGYYRNTSPAVDAFARKGVLFQNCFSQAPHTIASHMTLMTSLYPTAHGLSGMENDKRKANSTLTLARFLQDRGYATAAFTGGGRVSASYGFGDGFDVYRETDVLPMDIPGQFNNEEADRMFAWVNEHKGGPFFLFFHTYVIHDPYEPKEPYSSLFDPGYSGPVRQPRELFPSLGRGTVQWSDEIAHMVALYDGGIRQADDFLGVFFAYLREAGVWDSSIIVLMSDHGEEFLEHGGFLHVLLHGEIIKVPLIIVAPGLILPGEKVDAQVRLIDVFPTIIDLLGETPPDFLQGESLAPLMHGNGPNRRVFAEFGAPPKRRRSLSQDGWKLIEDMHEGKTTTTLFNIEDDPDEQHDVAPQHPEVVGKLEAEIEAIAEKNRRAFEENKGLKDAEIRPETLRQLKALGYLR